MRPVRKMELYKWTIISVILILPRAEGQNGGWGMIYRIKQVRDLLEQNQQTTPRSQNDYLLVGTNQKQNQAVHRGLGSALMGNVSRFSDTGLNPWESSMSRVVDFSPQMTASIQRPVLPPEYSSMRQNNFIQRNNAPATSTPVLTDIQDSQLSQQFRRPERTDAIAHSMDDFVGPDGKLKMTICDHPYGFLRRQKKLCRRYLHLMDSVVRGFFMGLKECEYRFSDHRWNCQGYDLILKVPQKSKRRLRYRQPQKSLSKRTRMKTYLDKLLSKGTRESAYVMAVTSAGVSHAVTKACSSGLHENCGCDRTIYDHPREPNFEWSGCSDNIHFGAAFSRQFLDVRERSRIRRRPKLAMTNLHNNHVGRQAVINKMEVQCKCHGVSGSCEMRTCWRSLPKFRNLGAHLQDLFHKAILVDFVNQQLVRVPENDGSDASLRRSSGLLTTSTSDNQLSLPTENDLLYISQSPTFCHHDPGYGSLGTYGRRCSENPKDNNSCDYLCCGRGFKRGTFVQEERCNCKFQWCCKVLCQTCRNTVVVSTCN